MNEASMETESGKTALRQFLAEVDAKYPPGWYVAIEDNKVLAASADFHDLVDIIAAQGGNPHDTVVVEAGAKHPEYMTILFD